MTPTTYTKDACSQLITALHILQASTIGLWRNHYPNSPIELVVEYDNSCKLVRTIHIGELGSLQDTHIPAEKGKLILFPEGQTLSEVMKDPLKLQDYCNQFTKNN